MDWRFSFGRASGVAASGQESARAGLLRSVCFGTCAMLACVMLCPTVALAQPAGSDHMAHDLMVRSTVPGAKALPAPGPDTPVPSWAQPSYKIYMEMKAKAHGGTNYSRDTYAKMPDWSGVWTHHGGLVWDPEHLRPDAMGIGPKAAQLVLENCSDLPCAGWMTGDLTPKYKLQYIRKVTAVAHGFEWDQLSDCLPPGFPRMLIDPFYREFIVTPQETWMSAETEGEFRRIYTDGRGHIPESEALPLWEGDSIAFWDNDTLAIHTMWVRNEEIQRNMPSLSLQASVIERVRLKDANTIQDEATIYDPLALKTPWPATISYDRIDSQHARMDMWSCEENNNVVQTGHGGSTFILPGESIMVKRSYRDPLNIQNQAIDKAIAYGAQLLKEDAAKSGGKATPQNRLIPVAIELMKGEAAAKAAGQGG